MQSKQVIPNTIDEFLATINQYQNIDSNKIFHCRACGIRKYHDGMLGMSYKSGKDQSHICFIYFCKGCLEKDTYDFIMQKNIDIRKLTLDQIKEINKAYFDGRYERWLSEG